MCASSQRFVTESIPAKSYPPRNSLRGAKVIMTELISFALSLITIHGSSQHDRNRRIRLINVCGVEGVHYFTLTNRLKSQETS